MKKIAILIFGRIWFIWFIIVVFSVIIVFYPLILFASKKHTRANAQYIAWIYLCCSKAICFFSCFSVKIVGQENYHIDEKYIITSNHRSLVDIFMFISYFPGKIIAKSNFFTAIPILGTYYTKGTILVDRQSVLSRRHSFEEMKKVLDANICMCIYPEGTRNKTKEALQPFQNGAFKLSKETNTPILPIVLFNTDYAVSTLIPMFSMPTQIQIHILPKVMPNDFATMEDMREAVRHNMQTYYEQHKSVIAQTTLFQYR